MTTSHGAFKRTWLVLGIVIVVVGLIVFSIGYFGLDLFRSNPDQVAIAPMTQKLDSLGGQVICDDGNSGPDMLTAETAWYEVYYRVPDAASARKAFFAAAATSGYRLLPVPGQSGDG